MSNIHNVFQELKTGLNSHINNSLKQVNPELENFKIYKDAYDLIMNSSIVIGLKKENRRLAKKNKKLTKLVLQLSNTMINSIPNVNNTVGPISYEPINTDLNDVVFIKVEKEIMEMNV